jgi:hypothetical protein
METISSIAGLKNAIQLLEAEQAAKGILLKEQFLLTYESLKPINILKSTLKEVSSSPLLIDNILGSAVGLATGYISKKIVIGTSGNIFRRLLGFVLEFVVTNVVAKNPEIIKSSGRRILQRIFKSKD